MALDLNTSPYYDDFNSAKDFDRILFKPGVAVQARELTQVQSLLQKISSNFLALILFPDLKQVYRKIHLYYIFLMYVYR